jgi:hypothetical protein
MVIFFTKSYDNWQQARPKESKSTTALVETINNLSMWLNQSQLFREAWEAAMISNARYFWSQPIFFITSIWSVLLARTNVRQAGLYMLLGQGVAISFAMNLSFVAMLQQKEDAEICSTPDSINAPCSKATKDESSRDTLCGEDAEIPISLASQHSLHIYMLFLVPTYICIALLQHFASTTWFIPLLGIPHILLLLLPMVLRSSSSQRSLSVEATKMLWAVMATASLVLQSCVINKALKETTRSGILSAIGEHPAVSSVGWDVLMSASSLTLWLGCQE